DRADLFIFPSHHEGFPRVLYEAMASALPIFTTFVGGIPGRMVHLQNCIEIPVKNGVYSAEIIVSYMKDRNVMERIGRNGQKTLENIVMGNPIKHEDLLINYIK